jgi:hypothetical protein
MIQTLNYFPGQVATIFLEILDGYGRVDSDTLPVVNRIILPNFTLAAGYPTTMFKVDVGLYYYQFTLPTGGAAVGSYLVDVSFDNLTADGYADNTALYQILVQAPFGNFSTTVVG